MTSTKTKGLVDARVDLYALGVMLYEMVAGVSPYPEGSNTQIIVYACTKDPLPLSGVEPPIEMPAALKNSFTTRCLETRSVVLRMHMSSLSG